MPLIKEGLAIREIILCDDHIVSLIGVESVVRKALSDQVIIRHASSGEEVLNLLGQRPADLIITDLGLPQMSGLDLIRIIRSQYSDCKIITLSASDDIHLLHQLVHFKVNAILKKLNTIENLVGAIDFVKSNSDEIFYDSTIEKLLRHSEKVTLSKREFEIVTLMSQGLTSQEIANEFKCSLATIKTHRLRMMNKIGARNSSEILAWFLTKGKAERNFCP